MHELCNAFVRRNGPALTVPEMMRVYRRTVRQLPNVLRNAGTYSPFGARVFEDLCFVTRANAELSWTLLVDLPWLKNVLESSHIYTFPAEHHAFQSQPFSLLPQSHAAKLDPTSGAHNPVPR